MAAVYKSLSKKDNKKSETTSDNGIKKNKQRVLILPSRGVTYRQRHLLNDLASMLPHGRKDGKFDSKAKLYELNSLCELQNSNNCVFFEARKGKDLYLHFAAVPNGPTIKFHVQNLHTMEELHFTGNCLKGSRPILSFDAAFEKEPYLQLIRAQFQRTFGVPQGARRSKPFIDHVMSFSVVDGKIWIRNYQISEEEASKIKPAEAEGDATKDSDLSLIEIGPRFVLTPIFISEGSFGGPLIFSNKSYVTPNQVRSDLRKLKATKHNGRSEQTRERLSRKSDLGLRSNVGHEKQRDETDTKMLFA